MISDPTGHYVYKLVSKQTLAARLGEAGNQELDCHPALPRFHAGISRYLDLNDAYFGIQAQAARASRGKRANRTRTSTPTDGFDKTNVVVTGISGNLGQRLAPLLSDCTVVGIDVTPPTGFSIDRFVPLDLGKEDSTRELYLAVARVAARLGCSLAFVIDPQRSGVLDVDRMWQINVAGTARVMEAITEANRNAGRATSASSSSPAACRPTVLTCGDAVTERRSSPGPHPAVRAS